MSSRVHGRPDDRAVTGAATSPVTPRLLIYYGIPQGVNGLWDDAAAAELFCDWDIVVFGVGLQDPGNVYHASTVAIIERMRATKPSIRVFGYIDLSVQCSNLPIELMRTHVRQWRDTGADSVLFDLAGYTFGSSRARQNTMVDEAHALGMAVMLNNDVPDDVLGSAVDEHHNPTGEAPHVGAGDYFLLESWVVSTSVFGSTNGYRWLVDAKHLADRAVAYRDESGVRIAAVNTLDYSVTPDGELRAYFRMAEAMAIAWKLDAYGFGPTGYSGVVPNVNVVKPLPYDPRYVAYVTGPARYSANPAVTEITRADIPLVVHIDVSQGVFWSTSPR